MSRSRRAGAGAPARTGTVARSLVWDKTTLIWSKDVQGVANNYYDTINFGFASLK